MTQVKTPRRLRIGVDVGGTNTDGVILDPLEKSPAKAIKAWHKTPTTEDPGDGIESAIRSMLQLGSEGTSIDASEIASVTIGTTHFVNAIVEMDKSRLSRVAVLRLCGPFTKHVVPCADWDPNLVASILGHWALLKGGLEVDGHLISDIDENEVKAQCNIIKQMNVESVVIAGVFSPTDTVEKQEERVAAIVSAELPGYDIVCSRDVAGLGFLERENAAILNAVILRFARRTIRSFRLSINRLGLDCPVFVTQNDGTAILDVAASKLPIRTFSSGPTNSIRGAAFLAQSEGPLAEDVMVVDIGGTTTDVGLLQKNGFPRQQAAYSHLCGVRINFPCPDVKSVGLGGGSIVRVGGTLTVGPDSVGHRLTHEAVVFGGETLTATDLSVLSNPALKVGNSDLLVGRLNESHATMFRNLVKLKLEKIIDTMKTAQGDISVILVGGGAIIAPDKLHGASRVLKPALAPVANAIGAATARISAVEDIILSTEKSTTLELVEKVKICAIEKTIAAGAEASSVEIVEIDTMPLPYISHQTRFKVRAAGEFDSSKTLSRELPKDDEILSEATREPNKKRAENKGVKNHATSVDDSRDKKVSEYRPDVRGRTWYISETDLTWITTGCYILGTGGGGSPYTSMLRIRTSLRQGSVVRVVDPRDVPDDARVGCGSAAGSPVVAIEKLSGDEITESQQELYKLIGEKATHMISLEIGGANGLSSFILGDNKCMDLPVVDGDWMGRAYPTKWQTTPVVFNERTPIWTPIAMSDGNGNVVVMPKSTSDTHVDRILRAALSQMGSLVGCAESPVSGAEMKRWVVQNTISQAWRIGRGVARAREENRIADVAEAIIDECGGETAGRVIFKGMIVGVERILRGGLEYGECLIQGADVTGGDGSIDHSGPTEPQFSGLLKIPFKNENIAALKVNKEGEQEQQKDVLAIVPDLISIIDAQSGDAVGTPEYRYGLLVTVLALTASNKWTSTERGVKLGGPEGFGFDHLKYEPIGQYHEPRSVIDEFDA